MAKHQNISSPYAVHPFAFSSNADPANDGSIDMAPYKGWIDTGNSNLLKVRNAANGAWEDVSVAGAATAPALGSNSASVTTYNDNAGTLAAGNAHHHIGVTSLAHTSNTYSGPITLTTPGNTVGITSPGTGQLAFTATGGSGGSAEALASAAYTRSAGDYTTTSTSVVDVDATNLALTITTGARRCLVGLAGTVSNSTTGQTYFDIDIDGTKQGQTSGPVFGLIGIRSPTANYIDNCSFQYLTNVLTAGSHTFKLCWATNTGTSTLQGGSANKAFLRFWVVELST